MAEFCPKLPGRYKLYFSSTADRSLDEKSKPVLKMTRKSYKDFTLLKIGIARILLLCGLFNKE